MVTFLKMEDTPETSSQQVGSVSSIDAHLCEVKRASAVVQVGLTLMAFAILAILDFDALKGGTEGHIKF